MPSLLSWIDYDSEAQQRAQRILTLFKVTELTTSTLDERGEALRIVDDSRPFSTLGEELEDCLTGVLHGHRRVVSKTLAEPFAVCTALRVPNATA